MGRIRIWCGRLCCIEPILKMEVSADDIRNFPEALKDIVKLIDIAYMYNGYTFPIEREISARVDEEFPYATTCMLKFDAHADAIRFLNDIRPEEDD